MTQDPSKPTEAAAAAPAAVASPNAPKSPAAAGSSPPKSSPKSPRSETERHEPAGILAAAEDEPDFDDNDSAFSDNGSSLTSLRSSVKQYQMENGRTYHGLSAGKYAYPNDEAESDRLDLQHNLWLLTLRGSLCISPKEHGARRVLDIGTGTGIWAIEYADAHPEAEVIGVDLSPIQPTLVPPNCSFEADDVEKEWTWTEPFDFIFSRVMAGSLEDYQAYVDKAFAALEPGGWFEMQDLTVPYGCDDGTMTEGSPFDKMGRYALEASQKLGRPLNVAESYKANMEKAGFVDIVEKKFKWPIGTWPADPHYKELGAWYRANLDQGLEGLMMALLTRGLGFSSEEATLFCAQVRPQLRNPRVHVYLPIIVVYGRKPEAATA